jgi:hypothetical protein
MTVFRKDERPSLARRLAEAGMAIGAVALVVGLVGAFVVAGMSVLHSSLDRNGDPNLARAPSPAPEAARPAPAAALRPAPPSPSPPPAQPISAAPPPPRVPAPPLRPRDPSRLDDEGFVRYWLILAPIPARRELAGAAEVADERIPGEASMMPRSEQAVTVAGRDYVWKRYRSPEFLVDFRKFAEGGRVEEALAYAVCYVVSPEDRDDVRLFVGSNDQCRVYLNGESVFRFDKSRTLRKDQDVVSGLKLRKGANTVILKVANEKGAWQGCLRLGDAAGSPLLNLHVTSTPP